MKDSEKSRKAWTRGARRLLDALQRGPPRQHLALPLLLLVAQQRQIIMVRGGRGVHAAAAGGAAAADHHGARGPWGACYCCWWRSSGR